jgi:hypothetical protein
MQILKDFIRMAFGMPDDAQVTTGEAVGVIIGIIVIVLMIGIAST